MAATSNVDCIYQFKIQLKGIRPPIWRRVQVPKEYSFFNFHMAIQDAMGWKDYHLHQFKITKIRKYIGIPSNNDDEDLLDGKTLLIGAYFVSPKDKIMYEYDFGDGWEHIITLEKILPAAEGVQYPHCIDGKRACPPEDCGGVCGYMELLDVIANPRHVEHEEMKEWLGSDFNPEKFDKKFVKFRDPQIKYV